MGIIRLVFHLPLRQTRRFMESIAKMMELDLRVPDFSTVSLRIQKLRVNIQSHIGKQGTHIIIDSTGLSVYDYLPTNLPNRLLHDKNIRIIIASNFEGAFIQWGKRAKQIYSQR